MKLQNKNPPQILEQFKILSKNKKKVKFCRETSSFDQRAYLTIVNSGQELVGAQRQLRPVVAVHPLTGVV